MHSYVLDSVQLQEKETFPTDDNVHATLWSRAVHILIDSIARREFGEEKILISEYLEHFF